ncbi:GntR family transcriptional regulator [soil metagenome]
MATSPEIAQRILHSVLAGKLCAGDRLGEQPLATLFGCSRTVVREALTELAVRGLIASSARRGWFVVELTPEQARQAFEARQLIETAVLRHVKTISPSTVQRLREHVERQQEAIRDDDVGLRSFLLGDFHVCLADSLGNAMLSETLRDLTARTMLVAMRHQSTREAMRSCAEHAQIVEALAVGDMTLAEQCLTEHLRSWDSKLHVPETSDDPLDQLRQALEPVHRSSIPSAPAKPGRGKHPRTASRTPRTSIISSTTTETPQ